MAKSKNHTGHNQVYKNHRNGIKKTRRPRKMSMQGMNCKFIRNQAFAKRGMACSAEDREARLEAQKASQAKMEEKKAHDAEKQRKDREAEAGGCPQGGQVQEDEGLSSVEVRGQ